MTSESKPTSQKSGRRPTAPGDLPHDELLRYGRGLGLELQDDVTSAELTARVQKYCLLLQELDREALLDVIKWSRRPVRENAGKEELAREIASMDATNYDSLSRRGLLTLAQMRGLTVAEVDTAESLITTLRQGDGLWKRWRRKRRKVVGSWLSKMLDSEMVEPDAPYQFLPDEAAAEEGNERKSLKRRIEDYGVVGGIASRLRGAADDYIKIKLDEIEQRIDDKLNDIDQRLAEWRDREVANRLRILRITLGFTVLVAIMSLGYNYFKNQAARNQSPDVQQVMDRQ